MIDSNEMFEANMTKWCETVKHVILPIIEKAEEEEMAANLMLDSTSGNKKC